MTARQFSLSYSTFSPNATYSPSPGLPSPEHHFEDDLISDKFVDNLTSPDNFGDMLSPTTTTSANSHDESAAGAGAGAYPSSTQEVIASAWKRADAAKKADEERDRLLEVSCDFQTSRLKMCCLLVITKSSRIIRLQA